MFTLQKDWRGGGNNKRKVITLFKASPVPKNELKKDLFATQLPHILSNLPAGTNLTDAFLVFFRCRLLGLRLTHFILHGVFSITVALNL